MNGSLRRSFAAKLIVGGCLIALVVVGGVAGYLIYSRTAQTRSAAQSNADNRVGTMVEVLNRFTGAQSLAAAQNLAAQPALAGALAAPDPSTAVAALFGQGTSPDLDGEVLVVTDSQGGLLFSRAAAAAPDVAVTAPPAAIGEALAGGRCSRGSAVAVAGGCGVDLLDNGDPAYVVAIPVTRAGRTVGAVAYVAPLTFQLDRFEALFSFPTAFIPARRPDLEFRTASGRTVETDPSLRAALSGRATTYHAIYNVATTPGGSEAVAGSFMPLYGSKGALTGYVGVEVPLSQFVGDERSDIVAVALISIFLLLIVVIAVTLFVERFVKRPVAQLESGVARIAGGDYATSIPVHSEDELGRLATDVNRMRDAISGYVREIEQARRQLDQAVEQVSGVSRALTTTTTGVAALQGEVVRAAASMAGGNRSAFLAVRVDDRLSVSASEGSAIPLSEWAGIDDVLGGQTVRLDDPVQGRLLAVPMFYQDSVIGALATVTPRRDGAAEPDADILGVLANNAAIAMENARLFEQERETVRRLRELDSLKTDFLGTVQHELRTPLTAILGLADLLEMCWDRWDDAAKMDAVHDLQVAAKNLYDLVETIIDYSALEDDLLGVHPVLVPVRAAVMTALELVGERYKDGLPVPVEVSGEDDVSVFADPDRFARVVRAILDNSIKFSDGRGRVTVTITTVNLGQLVRLEFADQGVGIPGDELPQIFDRFFQVDNTATRKFGGTGMGLALVKRVVAAHGAVVRVESVVGEGTVVTLAWPASPEAAAAEAHGAPGPGDRPAPSHSSEPVVPVQ